jgi:hypothetical protein
MDSCKYCRGPLGYLGILGRLMWFRCRACGSEQAAQVCDDCEGMPELYDETTGETECCATCDGSGLKVSAE